MKTTEWFLNQLKDEAPRIRRALERVPEGRDDWKPHEKSMPLGQLAHLVATMPSWIRFIVDQEELDVAPPGGGAQRPRVPRTQGELMEAYDKSVADAEKVLRGTNDEHLKKPWRLLAGGQVVSEDPREIVLRDTFMHLAHHRGQLTVYLRLNNEPVPSIYGPTADDKQFA
ncbi:MAG: DinB family protein [Bacteroidota bacterium]